MAPYSRRLLFGNCGFALSLSFIDGNGSNHILRMPANRRSGGGLVQSSPLFRKKKERSQIGTRPDLIVRPRWERGPGRHPSRVGNNLGARKEGREYQIKKKYKKGGQGLTPPTWVGGAADLKINLIQGHQRGKTSAQFFFLVRGRRSPTQSPITHT